MQVILGGKFENALIHSIDEIQQPSRNSTTHEYYAGLNRRTPKAFFERCGTFIGISDAILMPVVDWGYSGDLGNGVTSDQLGITKTQAGGNEWEENPKAFAEHCLPRLSVEARTFISILDLSKYPEEARTHIQERLDHYKDSIAIHYICRLLLQMRASNETGAYLLLSEDDISLIKEIGAIALSGEFTSPPNLPDLREKVIDPDTFCDGLFNYCPKDILAVAAVRLDPHVKKYAQSVKSALAESDVTRRQEMMITAMQEACESNEAAIRAEKVFEIASWIVKPLHYVPIAGNVLSLAEDAKDAAAAITKHEAAKKQWYLLAARMTDIAVTDYLKRRK